ncbi:unnamed protein product [marine sediment metagenome]|uniref:Uncharacterized protein n=1 Tax=marine sediment metagenome TaxID=412755 RepID=X1A6L3_9ZZZZ
MPKTKKYACVCKECGKEFQHEQKGVDICFDCAIKEIMRLRKEDEEHERLEHEVEEYLDKGR